jgi:histone acetyltransferase MYST1
VGSPEKPLSDLGLLSYRSYWSWVLLGILRENPDAELSVMDLTAMTSIVSEDIVSTLRHHGLIRYVNGQHVICADPRIIEERFQKLSKKTGPLVDPAFLHWAPLPPPLSIRRDRWALRSKLRPHDDTGGNSP